MTQEIRSLEKSITGLKGLPPMIQATKAPTVLNQALAALKRMDERLNVLESKLTFSEKGARNHDQA